MIGDEILSQLLRATFLSARVKAEDTKVVSLFLVAPFERGKTSMALNNRANDAIVMTDASGMGLLEALLQHQKATHIIVNDLSAVTGHRETVSKLTISILNGLAEEGTFKIAVPRMQHLDLTGRKIGVIASCVPSLVKDQRAWWIRSGFLSRMLIAKFDHSVKLQNEIMDAISRGKSATKIIPYKFPDYPVPVSFPEKIARRIKKIATTLARKTEEVGYRKQKQLRGLMGGHAILRGCDWKKGATVSPRDIDFLYDALPFFEEGKEL
jgi:hypothetical protein